MRLLLHTFRKDSRRLWPAVGITLALLATLAREDRWRADRVVGLTEGWLNLLLPLAWACLIALAILEEPLVGTRHFWLTRPYRWQSLLGAKALFAVAYVHVPLLVADCYVLAARGFSPVGAAAHLAGRQVLLACALSVPSLALAAMVGNFTQFVLMVLALGTVTNFFGAAFEMGVKTPAENWLSGPTIAALVLGAGLAILYLQYRRRGTAKARGVGVAAALVVAGVAMFWPEAVENSVHAALRPIGSRVALQLDATPRYPGGQGSALSTSVDLVIPVEVTGLPAGALFQVSAARLTVTAANGKRYENPEADGPGNWERRPFQGWLTRMTPEGDGAVLFLRFERKEFARLRDTKVRIAGQALVKLLRKTETRWMAVGGGTVSRELGRCTASLVEDRWAERVKVLCEAAREAAAPASVMLWTREGQRPLYHRLNDSFSAVSGPRVAWLSPVARGTTFLGVSRGEQRYPGTVLEEDLGRARIGVMAEVVTGYAVVEFDFRDVAMGKW